MATAVLISACGTGDSGVELVDPTPTLFADDGSDLGVATEPQTGAPAQPEDEFVFSPDQLPSPRTGAAGIVEVDGWAVPAVAPTNDGWEVVTPCGSISSIVGASPHKALVVLDPGHGGDDRGATNAAADLEEAELNLEVATQAAEMLLARGIDTRLTRTGDRLMTATARGAAADASGARVLVSIHHRGTQGPATEVPGVEAIHQIGSEESRRLAGLLYEELTAGLAVAGIDWAGPEQAGVRPLLNQRGSDYFAILRGTAELATVYVEVGSIATESAAAFLAGDDGPSHEAEAISDAVVRYLVTNNAGSGYVQPLERVRQAPSGDDSIDCVESVAPSPD